MRFEGLQSLFTRSSPPRWRLFGADGRLLDVVEQTANYIGQSVQLIPPSGNSIENFVSILDARSSNPANPEIVTINLSIDNAGPIGQGTFVIPQARIVWGSGGSLNTAIVDVIRGTQVSVAASLIRVDGVYNAPFGGIPTTNIRMNANLAYEPRSGSYVAPGFTSIGTVAKNAGTISFFPIPQFAKDVQITSIQIVGGGYGDPADLEIYFTSDDDPTAPAAQASFKQNQGTVPNTVFALTYPIPGYTRQMAIKNLTVANDAVVTLRFGLAL